MIQRSKDASTWRLTHGIWASITSDKQNVCYHFSNMSTDGWRPNLRKFPSTDPNKRWNRISIIFIRYFMGIVRRSDNGADTLGSSACIYSSLDMDFICISKPKNYGSQVALPVGAWPKSYAWNSGTNSGKPFPLCCRTFSLPCPLTFPWVLKYPLPFLVQYVHAALFLVIHLHSMAASR